MKWTKDYPAEPKTYWWHRERYNDGSISKPTVIRVEKNRKWGIVYRSMGDASSCTPDEVKADYEKYGVTAEFAGPLVPPEDEEYGR